MVGLQNKISRSVIVHYAHVRSVYTGQGWQHRHTSIFYKLRTESYLGLKYEEFRKQVIQ